MERKKVNEGKAAEKGQDSSTSMLTRESEFQEELKSVNAVFANPLLMDKIIKYTIHDLKGKQISKQNVMAIRLVNKQFLCSASRVLKISGDWLITLEIGTGVTEKVNRITREKRVYSKDNILDKFLSVFAKPFRSSDSILPVYFHIEKLYMIKKNSESLTTFFELLNEIISGLSLEYPVDVDSMNLECNNLTFPNLQTFVFKFETWTYADTDPTEPCLGTANALEVIQHVLQNSPNLHHLTLIYEVEAEVNIGSINLPKSLKSFATQGCPLTVNELALLTNNQLPNLNALNLNIRSQKGVPVMCKILEPFRKQLTNLIMNITDLGNEKEESNICTKFPILENLKCLKLSGADDKLSTKIRQNWPKVMPNLTRLVFDKVIMEKESLLKNWIQGLRFDNVKKLKYLPSCYVNDEPVLSPSAQIIKEIITSFPNIQKLTCRFEVDDISSLKYLFQNFTHLEKLHLNFSLGLGRLDDFGYKIVSVLLGISLEEARASIIDTENIGNVQFNNQDSIMNLKELRALTLWIPEFERMDIPTLKMYAEVLAQHGFESMPKLQKTKLLGGLSFSNNTCYDEPDIHLVSSDSEEL